MSHSRLHKARPEFLLNCLTSLQSVLGGRQSGRDWTGPAGGEWRDCGAWPGGSHSLLSLTNTRETGCPTLNHLRPSQTILQHQTPSHIISPQLNKTQYYTTETVLKLTQSYQLTSESKYSVKGIVPSQTRFNMDMDHPPYHFFSFLSRAM